MHKGKHLTSQKWLNPNQKRASLLFNISDTVFDQKSPALLVPVTNGGDTFVIRSLTIPYR